MVFTIPKGIIKVLLVHWAFLDISPSEGSIVQ